MRNNRRLAFFFTLILSGCASGPKFISQDFHPPKSVAVLLFANETNDVEAPELVRKILNEILPRHGYSPVDGKEVADILKTKFGITDGGQLGSVTAEELGKAMNADGLFFGNVLSFQDLPLGYIRKRTVKVNLKLYDALTGKVMWEDEKGWTTPEIHINAEEARRAAAWQVIDRQRRRIDGTFLREETILALEHALRTLPAQAFGPQLPSK